MRPVIAVAGSEGLNMKKIISAAFLATAALALAGCGSSDSADEAAQAENVELPAEEQVPVDASVAPVADESAAASTDAAAQGSTAASDAAVAGDAATKAVEAATKQAEKKM
jgi:hypothetical protein